MSRRLVIPTGDTPSTVSPIRGLTWQQVANDNRCDAIENLGSQWCLDNGISGLGIATEAPPPGPPASDIPGLKFQLPPNVDLKTVAIAMRDRVIAQLDPNQADPTTAQLTTAICVLVLALIDKTGV